MSDNEIIKALECCIRGECGDCPAERECGCEEYLHQEAINLINHQKAEIEKLSADIKTFENIIKGCFLQATGIDVDPFAEIKVEAIKEFAERLVAIYENDKTYDRPNAHTLVMTVFRNIDNLVEKMVGELQ